MSRACALCAVLLAAGTLGFASRAHAQQAPRPAHAPPRGSGASPAASPAPVREIPVVVTFVAGGQVYLDRGSEDGLAIGDRVRLHPWGAGPVEGQVVEVSPQSARVALPAGASVDAGTPGIALDPGGRAGGISPTERAHRDLAPHPGWRRDAPAAGPDEPLLAPVFRIQPADRPARFGGRVSALLDSTFDLASDRSSNRSHRARLGSNLRLDNPFGAGGRLTFDGELALRTLELEDVDTRATSRGRLDRLYYRLGGNRDDRTELRVGRLDSALVPELGVLDGVEASLRTEGGMRLGLHAGSYPEPSFERASGDDIGASLAVEQELAHGRALVGLALHQSWHRGDPDRTLAIVRARHHPSARAGVQATAWIDFYDGDDAIKSGAELTQLQTSARWQFHERHGLHAGFVHLRWPELLRAEFAALPADVIDGNRFERAWVSSWHRLGSHLRLDTRLDGWQDQDDERGTGGDLGLTWTDFLRVGQDGSAAVFYRQALFVEGPGLRVGLRRHGAVLSWRLDYEAWQVQTTLLEDGQERALSHAVRAGLDAWLGDAWTWNLGADLRFGRDERALVLSTLLEYRF